MTEQNNLEKKGQETRAQAKNFVDNAREFLIELLNIRNDTNEEGTIQNIRDGIAIQGHTAWILVFSIMIASIGLNANSTAVVIGAMLISPLMGPILGIGTALGINDLKMMRRSLINLGVMIVLSLITSFIYFKIPLFQDSTSELLARTRPDIRDVMIAACGGFALIIALSRPSPQTNTVAGVAIATALMPPLCTAGYGLALGNFSYFFGAMFLFSINCIFIALATFGTVKYLRFKMVKYQNAARRKRINRLATFIALLLISGSVYSFYTLIQENTYKQRANLFISELKSQGYAILGDDSKIINYEEKKLFLPILGTVSAETRDKWEERLVKIGLEGTTLDIVQENNSELQEQVTSLKNLYEQNAKLINTKEETIKQKDDRIRLLEDQLSAFYNKQIPFEDLSKEARINYTNLEKLSFYNRVNTDFEKLDSMLVFEAKWKDNIKSSTRSTDQKRLYQWLVQRLKVDTLDLVTR